MSLYKKSLTRNLIIGVLSLLLGSGLMACGGASNNDQGTSFLALGYYTFVDESGEDVIPISGVTHNLYRDSIGFEGVGNSVQGNVLIGLENRLEVQFIRITRVDCSYHVEGADPGFQIPDDSFPTAFVLGANPGSNVNQLNNDGLLPSDTDNVRPQVAYNNIPLVGADINAFLAVNQNSLPELPYQMSATCRGVGITQAGDVLTTNPLSIPVYVVRSSPQNASAAEFGGSQLLEGSEDPSSIEPEEEDPLDAELDLDPDDPELID